MKIFLSFIGNNDCFLPGKKGAVISVLEQIQFDKAYLFYNHEKYLKHGAEIQRYCGKHFPKLKIILHQAPALNPTDYNLLYPAMYAAVKENLKKDKNGEYTISLSSGTPAMHSCWIFLVKGGVINAKMIQVSIESGISEVNFNLDDFPEIRQVKNIKAEMTRLSRENQILKNELGKLDFDPIIGGSREIINIKEQIKILMNTDIPVFIYGPTGTGKELVAESIHYNSFKKEKPIIKVNCGAIPPELFESEFFGHKKGAFTGAVSDKEGKFKLSDGGTIFLDEIADLPRVMQVKLLRVLDSGTFTPVGSTKEERVNIRVISAANNDLRELVKNGKFRQDLFYRLVNAVITLPPLSKRQNDSILIAQQIISKLNQKYGKNKILSKSAADLILKYHWPGNIRQLKNVLETAHIYPGEEIILENKDFFDIEPFDIEPVEQFNITIPENGIDLNNEVLPRYYEAALKTTGGNAAKAAKLLGMKPHAFRARLKKNRT
ncbi:PAS modulated sigma54-dependent transcriptional regulator, Fis-type [Desulfonema limicola]|uniref:PAS modulated sigma54-dependent transcriptional regulator, Fis-type n=1 Tax=Desulfonema limicola TaxID=45656 RepID=A0A975GF50_9BACT|nr:sigma-54 dependent transcriptional regulator [Desulfonema limicola]QTA78911.1 PAS modulated sigma54-dependent transcriptional regulator, Fis-type [Desulfonema limicola]